MPQTIHATSPPTLPSGPVPVTHPMDPRRGQTLSPKFAAILCWLLELPPLTEPAIVDLAVSGECVLAATTDDLLFDTHLGDVADLTRNLRGWARACEADPAIVEGLIAKARRTGA